MSKEELRVISGRVVRIHHSQPGFCVFILRSSYEGEAYKIVTNYPVKNGSSLTQILVRADYSRGPKHKQWKIVESTPQRMSEVRSSKEKNRIEVSKTNMRQPSDSQKQILPWCLDKIIAPSYAKKLVNAIDQNNITTLELWKWLDADDKEHLIKIKGFGTKSIEHVLKDWNTFRSMPFDQLLSVLAESGAVKCLSEKYKISREQAKSLYTCYELNYTGKNANEQNTDVLQTFEKNPYLFATTDNFTWLDEIATKQLKIELDAPKRLASLINLKITEKTKNQGHTCVRFSTLLNCLPHEMQYLTAEQVLEHPCFSQEQNSPVTFHLNDSVFVYTPYLWTLESYAVNWIENLRSRTPTPFEGILQHQDGITLSDQQREAILMTGRHFISVVCGYSGSGKTTTMKAVVQYHLANGQKNVILCSPTGMAAQQLSIATGHPAQTIHKLIFQRFVFKDDTTLIIDESSMVDMETLGRLAKIAMKVKTLRVIFVGDDAQLPPVGPGMPFFECINNNILPSVKLTQVFRQNENMLLKSCMNVRLRQDKIHTDYQHLHMIRSIDPEKIVECVIKTLHLTQTIPLVLCARKQGPSGTVNLNRLISQATHTTTPVEVKMPAPYNDWKFYENDIIMFINNTENTKNGERGCITSWTTDHTSTVKFNIRKGDQMLYGVSHREIIPAYAVTVHKSQGIQADTVVFVVENHSMIDSCLVYTAMTRTKQLLCMFVDPQVQWVDQLDLIPIGEHHKRVSCFTNRLTFF